MSAWTSTLNVPKPPPPPTRRCMRAVEVHGESSRASPDVVVIKPSSMHIRGSTSRQNAQSPMSMSSSSFDRSRSPSTLCVDRHHQLYVPPKGSNSGYEQWVTLVSQLDKQVNCLERLVVFLAEKLTTDQMPDEGEDLKRLVLTQIETVKADFRTV